MTPLQATVGGGVADVLFLLGRVLFGFVLAFTGLNHFLQVEGMAGYAEAKGLPAPRLSVLGSGGALVFGGLGVAAGLLPTVAAGALALFLLVSALTMHDFWAVPEDQQQEEMTHFLKNVALAGAALALLAVSAAAWPFSAGVSLF